MADFLPIGLGRDGAGNVSHFQEITSSDSIPENYLQVFNTSPKWNASALQSVPVCTNTPTEGQSLVYSSSLGVWCASTVTAAAVVIGQTDSSSLNTVPICATSPITGDSLVYNGSEWCPSAAGGGGAGGITGPVSVTAGNAVVWDTTTTVNDGGWGFTPTAIGDGNVVYWDDSTKKISDTGLAPDDAGWNSNKIQGVSASPTAPTDGQVWVYDNGNSRWTPSTLVLTGGGGGDSNATSIISYPITGTPNNDDVLVFDSGDGDFVWEPRVKSSGTLTANKIIIGDSLGGVSASYATLGTFVDGNVIRYLSGTSAINDAGWGISQADVVGIVNNRILQWSSVGGVRRIVDSGYARTDAAWNANSIQGVSATPPVLADHNKVFTYLSSGEFVLTPKISQATAINFLGELQGDGSQSQLVVGVSGGGTYTVSGLSGVGTFLVTSGNSVVPAFLPDSLLRFYGAINGSFPTKAPPAELVKTGGELLYYDITNDRYTNTGNVKVVGANNLTATNLSGTGTVQGATVSATTYLNVRPYVSAVDSATTTTVNIAGNYDTYIVNTTTTGVTLYLPDASAYNNKKITISKIDDSGSYRSVTLSGAQLQTATNTVRLYDPTESVTVISNGTNWYSLDYDRAYGVVLVCKNNTGVTLDKGTPVKVTGATGDNVLIGPVSAANDHVPEAPDGDLSRCIGVVEHTIPTGEFGHVLTKGTLYKFNTNAYNEGDILYLAPSGGFTNVKPASPYDEVFLGIVTRKSVNNGSILIDVANPIHINDIVGMNLTSSLVNGDLISYSTDTSTFTNVQTVNVSGQGKFGSVSATNISGTTITATTLSATTISTPKYPTYIYTATGISVGTNKLMFDMFNGAGSGKTLKVTRIVAYVRNTTTITGINQVLECYRTSSVGTGGTTVTEAKMVTSDPALNANITARNTPTGGASYYNPSGVLAAANIYTEEGQNLQERVYLYMYDSFAGLEECLTVREGEGLRINTGAVGGAGVIAIYVYFITV